MRELASSPVLLLRRSATWAAAGTKVAIGALQYLGAMKVAVELEFPAERAAAAFQWLQSLPADIVAHFASCQPHGLVAQPATEELSEAEQHQLLHEVFGSWKSEESGEEMVRRIYADRQDQPREVAV